MLINKRNLSIFPSCAKEPDDKGRAINNLQITGKGTVVTNGYYSIAVSALEPSDFGSPVLISPDSARELLTNLGDREGTLDVGIAELHLLTGKTHYRADIVRGKFPRLEGLKDCICPNFEMTIDVKYLLAIVQSIAEFGGDVARVSFFSPLEPVRIDSRNAATGQKIEALVMGRKPGYDAKTFEPDPPAPAAEPQDEFTRAMAEAAKLMGE